MRKKWGLLFGAALIGGLIWYLFLKPHDYVVRFEIKASAGTINQTIKSWSNSIDSAQLLGQKSLSNLKYRFKFNDTVNTYHWKLIPANDSVTKVRAYVTDEDHSLANRLAIPFSPTILEKRTEKLVTEFTEVLKDHLKNFKVKVTGTSEIPAKYCACVALKGSQKEKAKGMKEYYSLLSGVMGGQNSTLDGRPLLEVEDWNLKNDSLSYNFCFPVIKSDSLPERPDIFYKQIERTRAIRAVYNGNYITSDRAWYALLDYAENNNLNVAAKPLEIFHSNPNMGGNALEWEAEVFLPIVE